MTMKKSIITPALMILASSLLSGCAGFMNIGESDFSCPATQIDGGLKCMGVRDLYKATDGPSSSFGRKSQGTKGAPKEELTKLQPADNGGAGYDPTPWMDKPMPIRSQAKVMRIWVAPFEDEVGDLNAPGMVYTEIEARRWNVGEGLVKRPARLTPVQVQGQGGQPDPSQAASGGSPFGVTNASGQAIKGLKNIPVANPDGQQRNGMPGQQNAQQRRPNQQQMNNNLAMPGGPGGY